MKKHKIIPIPITSRSIMKGDVVKHTDGSFAYVDGHCEFSERWQPTQILLTSEDELSQDRLVNEITHFGKKVVAQHPPQDSLPTINSNDLPYIVGLMNKGIFEVELEQCKSEPLIDKGKEPPINHISLNGVECVVIKRQEEKDLDPYGCDSCANLFSLRDEHCKVCIASVEIENERQEEKKHICSIYKDLTECDDFNNYGDFEKCAICNKTQQPTPKEPQRSCETCGHHYMNGKACDIPKDSHCGGKAWIPIQPTPQKGNIHEISVYVSKLSDEDRKKVEDYLFNKKYADTPQRLFTEEDMIGFGLFCVDKSIERVNGGSKLKTTDKQLLKEYIDKFKTK